MKPINCLLILVVLLFNSCKTAEVQKPKSSAKEISSLELSGIAGSSSVFDKATNSYTFTVPAGTNIKVILFSISIPTGATSIPKSGTVIDFTNPVTCTITAEDGSTVVYTIKVVVQSAPKTSEKQILSFSFEELSPVVKGTINQSTFEITAEIPASANLKALMPTITLSNKATVSPASGISQDFTNPVKYTVSSEDGSKQEYTLKITKSVSTNSSVILIPDPLFEKYLVDRKIDTDNKINGEIAIKDALAVNALELYSVKSLKGIEGFKNLRNLRIYSQLSTLDISQNIALEQLLCVRTRLPELDISKNINLETLFFEDNSLKNLDVSKNVKLRELHSSNNGITSLNLKNNVNLIKLSISDRFETLDISSNIYLKELYYYESISENLNLSKNIYLGKLYVRSFTLKSIDLSKNFALLVLDIDSNNLSSLDISNSPELTELTLWSTNLSELNLSKNINLNTFRCFNNKIRNLDISKNIKLSIVKLENNGISDLDFSKNSELSELICNKNLIKSLDLSKNLKLSYLQCVNNVNLKTITVNKKANFSTALSAGITIVRVD